MVILYQREAYASSPKDTALEFARTYWAKPRKIRWGDNNSFKMVGGAGRLYHVLAATSPQGVQLYQIGADA